MWPLLCYPMGKDLGWLASPYPLGPALSSPASSLGSCSFQKLVLERAPSVVLKVCSTDSMLVALGLAWGGWGDRAGFYHNHGAKDAAGVNDVQALGVHIAKWMLQSLTCGRGKRKRPRHTAAHISPSHWPLAAPGYAPSPVPSITVGWAGAFRKGSHLMRGPLGGAAP